MISERAASARNPPVNAVFVEDPAIEGALKEDMAGKMKGQVREVRAIVISMNSIKHCDRFMLTFLIIRRRELKRPTTKARFRTITSCRKISLVEKLLPNDQHLFQGPKSCLKVSISLSEIKFEKLIRFSHIPQAR